MRLRPEPLPPMPATTAAAVRAAFPQGTLSVDLRAEFGTLSTAQLCAARSPLEGRPGAGPPWRLALVVGRQSIEGLTARQAAEAVRRCMEWKDARSLAVHAPGCAFTLLQALRQRRLAPAASPRVLATFLATWTARSWRQARGPHRPAAPQVLAASRTLPRVACGLEAMQAALTPRSAADPSWVQPPVPLDG
jgi:transposase